MPGIMKQEGGGKLNSRGRFSFTGKGWIKETFMAPFSVDDRKECYNSIGPKETACLITAPSVRECESDENGHPYP